MHLSRPRITLYLRLIAALLCAGVVLLGVLRAGPLAADPGDVDAASRGVVRVVSSYKHLGGQVSCMPSLRKEVAYRVKEASQATGQLSRRFLCRDRPCR